MRKAMLWLAFFGLAGWLRAADPFLVGTFKLNLAKSNLPASEAANIKEAIVTVRELDANTMEGTSTEVRKDGSMVSEKWTVPKSGGIRKYQQGGPVEGITIVSTVVDAYTVHSTYLKNDRQVLLMYVINSKDGKSYTIKWKGTDDQGSPTEYSGLYERQ